LKRLIVTVVFLFCIIIAANSAGKGEALVANPVDPVKLTWLIGGWATQVDPNGYFTQKVKEELNIDLTIEFMHNGQLMNTKRQVLIAGKEYPELMMNIPDALYAQWAKQGVFIELDKYWNKYPGLVAGLPEETALRGCRVDGKLYMVPNVLASNRLGIAYRQDWLDKLGLAVPETIDEFSEVMRAFAHDDPDGDGVKNTYGYGLDKFSGGGSIAVVSAYGLPGSPMQWHPEPDGTIMPNFLHKDFLKALALIQDHYERGIIDPDSFTKIYNDLQNDFLAGRTGSFVNQNTSIVANEALMQKIEPEAKIVHGPPIISPDGKKVWPFFSAAWRGVSITNKADERQIDAALRLFDWMLSEGEEFTFFGPEGVYWTEKNEIGYPIIEDDMLQKWDSTGEGYSAISLAMRRLSPETLLTPVTLRDPDAVSRVAEAFAIYEDYGVVDPLTGILTPTMIELGTSLDDIIRAGIFDIILNSKPVRSFEAVLTEWRQKGGTQLIKEVNDVYTSR
jgi:putative aldouronate transport system substrate-binding protein